MNSFTPTDRSRVKRLHERGKYDEESVFALLDAGFIAHIAYVIDGHPYVTPTSYWRTGRVLYWHGSSASRMLRRQSPGLPVCVTVSHIDGFVLARSGFHHSLNYRSVMAFGTAQIVEDPAEKSRELDRFIDRLFPGRRASLRPNNVQELKATTLIRMEIEEAAAKTRTGGPKDDDEDYALDCWAGVIPLRQVIGQPIADPKLRGGIGYPPDLAAFHDGADLCEVLAGNAEKLD
ncbi:pyridoxamine 5'-phosphate oxidase family protein [Dongia soli]|uniref:Pyridoxamine 5'-phosphate oxidase family protein n=1 Tax=Dongia soli TaxID=600628 RepID=A0ABU5E4R6_9PROT|nr:pyridoxamine 5'-phosphate oxidase family protein [Dongia soli]MDY0881262.1 pyridoxamine 5'-phosphate oxidase family protein [Dongia soli]